MGDKEARGRTRRIDRRYMVHSVARGASWKFGTFTYHRTRWTAEVSFWLFTTLAGRPTRLVDRGVPRSANSAR